MLFLLSTPFLSIWSSFSHGLAMWGSGRIRYFWNWILRPCELNRLASWPQYDWTLTRDWKKKFSSSVCVVEMPNKTASETVIDDGKEQSSKSKWSKWRIRTCFLNSFKTFSLCTQKIDVHHCLIKNSLLSLCVVVSAREFTKLGHCHCR